MTLSAHVFMFDKFEKFYILTFLKFSVGHIPEIGLGTTIFGISAKNGAEFKDSRPDPLLGALFRDISQFSTS